MPALPKGDRSHEWPSTSGGGAQRWVLLYSASRQAQAQRTGDTQWRQQSAKEGQACKHVCGPPCACEAEARQARAAFEQGGQATGLSTSRVRIQPRSSKRGRPGRGTPPAQVVSQSEGAWTASRPARQALIHQHSGFLLATNALDATPLPPQEGL